MRNLIKKLLFDKYLLTKMIRYVCNSKSKLSMCKMMMSYYLVKKYHVYIGRSTVIGDNISLPHPHNVVIGHKCVIGDNCVLYHDVTLGQNLGEYPTIGNDVIVYTGAKIIGGVNIGNGAIIGANAVVVKDVPENAIVGGIPAKVLGYRNMEKVYR